MVDRAGKKKTEGWRKKQKNAARGKMEGAMKPGGFFLGGGSILSGKKKKKKVE